MISEKRVEFLNKKEDSDYDFLSEDQKIEAESIMKMSFSQFSKKKIRNIRDRQSRTLFIQKCKNYIKTIEKDKMKYDRFLRGILEFLSIINASDNIPMIYIIQALKSLDLHKNYTFRAFTHFYEIRPVVYSINQDLWGEIFKNIKLYNKNEDNGIKYTNEKADCGIVIEMKGKKIFIECLHIKTRLIALSCNEVPNICKQEEEEHEEEKKDEIENLFNVIKLPLEMDFDTFYESEPV